MPSTNRFLLILVGASAWSYSLNQADLRELLDSASDIWRLPSFVASWHDLQTEAAQLDQRCAAMHRVCQARRDVVLGLCTKRIDVREAIHRFGALTALRARYGISGPRKSSSAIASREIAVQLLRLVKQARKEFSQRTDRDILDQVEAELQCSGGCDI